MHDAATGEIIWKGGQSGQDNGRGCAADIVADKRGQEFWSAYGGFDSSARIQNPFNAITGTQAGTSKPAMNFRIYWDGDLQDELLDGITISKYGGSTLGVGTTPLENIGSPSSCNGTKATPCLSADIFGDWREEVILWSTTDNATLNIYSTATTSNYRMPTLMHDHTYRMGICWQNTAYNQPPHLGYYLPDAMQPLLLEKEFTVNMGEEFELEAKTRYVKSVTLKTSILPDGTKKSYLLPDGMTRSFDSNSRIYTLKGITDQVGDYQIAVGLTQLGGGSVADTITIHSLNTTGIETVNHKSRSNDLYYDLQGRQQKALKPGINIIRQGNRARKVFVK